jgi:acyl transferase domain-containing protein/acyl carrier protein
VVGIGCRFPAGIHDASSYWQALVDGRDGIREVPAERWDLTRFYDPDPAKPGKMYVRAGGFLDQRLDEFDAQFFGVSPREAACLDPQQRLLLEVSWEALEDAGVPPTSLAGTATGVYVGGFMLDNMLTQMSLFNRTGLGPHSAVGTTMTILANRISYAYDLRGPSVSMDTACSSSLVAVHYACQGLWNDECSLALAGGVNVMFRPEYPIAMCKGHFLSPDGRCKSFDVQADGYGRGEGAGLVVLKRLSRARADGDRVYALVRATGVNQDGRTDGITVPNPEAQAELIRGVCGRAGVPPHQIAYFEAHGTGTPVGDPLEAEALGAAIGQGRALTEACWLGSAKANIGHLEAASGVAGMIKACLCLQHRQVPPQPVFGGTHPRIPYESLRLRIPRRLEPLAPQGPLFAGVNSFGYGGTNAHVLLEAPPAATAPVHAASEGPYLLPVSARSEAGLRAMCASYADALAARSTAEPGDFCATAGRHRAQLDWRAAFVGATRDELVDELRTASAEGWRGTRAGADPGRPVFVYTGMGPQWWAMGRELLAHEPLFRTTLEECDEAFRAVSGWSVLAEMRADEAHSRMHETHVAQPANFLLQVGLTALWRARGLEPAAVVGHSVGEVASAYVAGVLSLEDAARVSFHRSRIQKKAAGLGGMLAVGTTVERAQALIGPYGDQVSLAALNGPTTLTLAGASEPLREIAAQLEREGAFQRLLEVEVAYHSVYMEPLEAELLACLEPLRPRPPALPLYSTVTGERVSGVAYDAAYWYLNIRRPVLFARALNGLLDDGHSLFVEVGPHPVLSTAIKECAAARGARLLLGSSLHRKKPERKALLESLGALHCAGVPFDWNRIQAGSRVDLPTYVWQREPYWSEHEAALRDRLGAPSHPLLAERVAAPGAAFESPLSGSRLPWLSDHRVDGVVVFPGAGYVEAALAVQRELSSRECCTLEDLRFHKALVIDALDEPLLRVTFDENTRELALDSRPRDDGRRFTRHVTGRIPSGRPLEPQQVEIRRLGAACHEAVDPDVLYRELGLRGLDYGPRFRGVRELWRGVNEVWARVEATAPDADGDGALLHPTLLDACFQSLIAAIADGPDGHSAYLPVHIERLTFLRRPARSLWCHGRITRRSSRVVRGELTLLDADGTVLVEVRGLTCQALAGFDRPGSLRLEQLAYEWAWEPRELSDAPSVSGRFLLLADAGGVADALAAALRAAGAEPIVAAPSSDTASTAAGRRPVNTTRADLARLMKECDAAHLAGVVSLWPLDTQPHCDPVGIETTTLGLAVMQALVDAAGTGSPRLFFVTRGRQQVESEPLAGLAQAALGGLARVCASEFPQLHCTTLDLDPFPGGEAALLARELLAGDAEDELAYRAGRRWALRLTRTSPDAWRLAREADLPLQPVQARPFRLEQRSSGGVEALFLRQVERRAPQAGEIEIEVDAVALERMDLRRASGDASAEDGDEVGLGTQASGVVARVGASVTGWRPGQPVVFDLRDGLASHVTAPVESLHALPRPPHLSPEEAAPLPNAYALACYALVRRAALQPGESVLLPQLDEAATRAAFYVALAVGARPYVVCADPEQAQALRASGAACVLAPGDDLVDRVLQATAGRGVDVAWNALSSAGGADTLDAVAPLGRVVETDVRALRRLGRLPAGPFERGLTLCVADIGRVRREQPGLYRSLLDDAWRHVEAGRWPALGCECYDAAHFAAAFARLAQVPARPVVVALRAGPELRLWPPAPRAGLLRPDATYIVTGGCGGFGLLLARWMVSRGARHLALAGRRGAHTPAARAALEELRHQGIDARALVLDVSDPLALRACLDRLAAEAPPVRGVVHAAAVLDDDRLTELDAARLREVMLPKALGAWNLHQQTLGLELDFLLLFSSVSALIGNPGQGNYVAANVFLDALAQHRHALGLPATSLDWGVLGEVGMATDERLLAHLARVGLGVFRPDQAMQIIEQVLLTPPVQAGVVALDWSVWRAFDPATSGLPKFTRVAADAGTGTAHDARSQLLGLDPPARRAALADAVQALLAHTLRLPAEKLDLDQPLTALGVDSLLAAELRAALRSRTGLDLSMLELMQAAHVGELVERLAAKLETPPVTTSPVRPQAPRETLSDKQARDALEHIDALSDEQVARLVGELAAGQEVQP